MLCRNLRELSIIDFTSICVYIIVHAIRLSVFSHLHLNILYNIHMLMYNLYNFMFTLLLELEF